MLGGAESKFPGMDEVRLTKCLQPPEPLSDALQAGDIARDLVLGRLVVFPRRSCYKRKVNIYIHEDLTIYSSLFTTKALWQLHDRF